MWQNVFNSSVKQTLPANFGRNLFKEIYKIQWFKRNTSPNSIQSVYINDKKKDNSDTESSIVIEGIRTLLFFSTKNSKIKENTNSTLNKPKTF